MAGFDIAIGKWLMRNLWAKIWPDFDPRTGNYLSYGLLALGLVPLGVWWVKLAQRHAPSNILRLSAAAPAVHGGDLPGFFGPRITGKMALRHCLTICIEYA